MSNKPNNTYKRRLALNTILAAGLFILSVILTTPSAMTVFLSQNYGYAKKLPVYSVETPQKQVAITFDAAWAAGDTERILSILKENNIKATFFLCGIWIDKNPELLRALQDQGHDIGNHGDTHAHVASLSYEGNIKEITNAHTKVKTALGLDMTLFRPPYGEYNDTVLNAAEALKYQSVQWSVDSLDWKGLSVEEIINRILKSPNLKNGAIILFHSDAEHTADALDIIIRGLKNMGYEIVPVSELIYTEGYEVDHTGRQKLKE